MNQCIMEEIKLKFSELDPKEIEFMATLDWRELMTYLEKKYSIEFRDEFVSKFQNQFQNQFKETDDKWKN